MTSLTPSLSTVAAVFLASFVEVVEAFTSVLAVGATRSWDDRLASLSGSAIRIERAFLQR